MRYLFSKLLMVTLIASLSACSSDENSTAQPILSVNFNTVTSLFNTQGQTASVSKQASGGNFVFDDGFITLTAMEYEAESENDLESVEFELEQVVVIDFATGIPSPDIRAIEIPAGIYEEVSVELEILDETDEPSVVLTGTYTSPGGTSTPIRFEFNSGETFEVEREGTIVFAENESAVAQITFDPSAWFAGVTDNHMADATQYDGVIVISESQNSEIFDLVADGLDLATELEIEN
ncbi:hypothetical protein [Christiangramia sp.]|uniref:hypothetical protein n=1 Tax=Christiangramia sp. TaxID=1931228 RepID=UPI00260C31CD|nr:hypothetical protein [Christiangramia sp.]